MASDQRPPAADLPDDYRLLADSPNYIVAASIPPDRDLVLEIVRVSSGEIIGDGGRKSTKGLVYFRGHDRPMIINKRRGGVISKLNGANPREWPGKWLALYRGKDKGEAGGQVPAVAVRQKNPQPSPLTDAQQAAVSDLCGRISSAPDADVLEALIKPHRDAIVAMGPRATDAVSEAKSKRLTALAGGGSNG